MRMDQMELIEINSFGFVFGATAVAAIAALMPPHTPRAIGAAAIALGGMAMTMYSGRFCDYWVPFAALAAAARIRVTPELRNEAVACMTLPDFRRVDDSKWLMRPNGDAPAAADAYELYLRANAMQRDSTQWAAARDLYLQSVEKDPQFAPAWARLGRCYRLLGKYDEPAAAEANLARGAAIKADRSS